MKSCFSKTIFFIILLYVVSSLNTYNLRQLLTTFILYFLIVFEEIDHMDWVIGEDLFFSLSIE